MRAQLSENVNNENSPNKELHSACRTSATSAEFHFSGGHSLAVINLQTLGLGS